MVVIEVNTGVSVLVRALRDRFELRMYDRAEMLKVNLVFGHLHEAVIVTLFLLCLVVLRYDLLVFNDVGVIFMDAIVIIIRMGIMRTVFLFIFKYVVIDQEFELLLAEGFLELKVVFLKVVNFVLDVVIYRVVYVTQIGEALNGYAIAMGMRDDAIFGELADYWDHWLLLLLLR